MEMMVYGLIFELGCMNVCHFLRLFVGYVKVVGGGCVWADYNYLVLLVQTAIIQHS
jgi:hypothetical protein